MKWFFSDTSTKEPKAQFRTKHEAVAYGRRVAMGTFFVWKAKTKVKETTQ